MTYGVEVQLPIDVIDAINNAAQQSPKLMATATKRSMSRLKSRWLAALRVEPPDASNYYPLPYKSPAQRRKVHALRRERGGGAYVRTHDLSKAWDVDIEAAEDGGAVTVTNADPTSQFVYGDVDTPRQPMFDKIPWLDPIEVNNNFLDEATDVLIETWYTVSDPFAGVPT